MASVVIVSGLCAGGLAFMSCFLVALRRECNGRKRNPGSVMLWLPHIKAESAPDHGRLMVGEMQA